jgi:hypothetical protein
MIGTKENGDEYPTCKNCYARRDKGVDCGGPVEITKDQRQKRKEYMAKLHDQKLEEARQLETQNAAAAITYNRRE